MFYSEPVLPAGWERLSPLALPNFKEWAVPATTTSESYKVKLYKEIQKSLKATTTTKNVRITIFMPIEVFVDFFMMKRLEPHQQCSYVNLEKQSTS